MKFLFAAVGSAAVLLYAAGVAQSDPTQFSQFRAAATSPERVTPLRMPPLIPGRPLQVTTSVRAARIALQGDRVVEMMLRLREPGLGKLRASALEARLEQASRIRAAQDRTRDAAERLGATEIGRLRNVASAVLVAAPARLAPALEALPEVAAVHPIRNYEQHLGETVPYIGADLVHNAGITGSGVIVAVLDSGVDYTHADLGGSGNIADYNAAFGDPVNRRGWFPTPKITEGHDFVGESWPAGALAPDDDPIESNLGPGHGTHVTGVIAAVAPGADIYAVKVCSATGGGCPGSAILQGLDWVLDPDGNPGTDDAADVVNLSLGNPYGQPEDALWYVFDQLHTLDVVPVAAAGNGGHRPFIVSSPAAAPGAIAVGQVMHPDDVLSFFDVGGTFVLALHNQWSPAPQSAQTGSLSYGATAATQSGCLQGGNNPFATGSLNGQIVIVDRGTCSFSEKVANIAAAGGLMAIQADVVPQSAYELPGADPFGGNPVGIPAYTTNTLEGFFLKSLSGTTATLDPAFDFPVVDHMVGSSSSGPSSDGGNKPDVVAPGGAFSAQVGTGTGTGFFSGTSMSAPHVAGVAALIRQGDPSLASDDIKRALMNNANPNLFVNGGPPAPTSWAGAGVINANDALSGVSSRILSTDAGSGGLDTGYQPITTTRQFYLPVVVKNTSTTSMTIDPSVTYNDPTEALEVSFDAGGTWVVAPGSTGNFVITQTLNFPNLGAWTLHMGADGFDGAALADQEVDGRITFDVAGQSPDPQMPFNVLPKRVADLQGSASQVPEPEVLGNIYLTKTVVSAAPVEIFHLAEESANVFNFTVGDCGSIGQADGCDISPVDLDLVGIRDRLADLDNSGTPKLWLEVGLTVHDEPYRASQFPVQMDVRFDTDQDGNVDYIVFMSPTAVNGIIDGRNAVFVYNVSTAQSVFSAWTDSDFNSQNWILPVPAPMLGLGPGDPYDWFALAWDYYREPETLWDCSPYPVSPNPCGSVVHTFNLSSPRFDLLDGDYSYDVPTGGPKGQHITGYLTSDSPSDEGFFALYRLADVGRESDSFRLVVPGSDDDGDGAANGADCDPDNPHVFAKPSEVANVRLARAGTYTTTLVTWDSAVPTSGSATFHRIYTESNEFGAVGNAPDGGYLSDVVTDSSWLCNDIPDPGKALRVLIDAQSDCGPAGLGTDSNDNDRIP